MRHFSRKSGVFQAFSSGKRTEILIYDEIGSDPDIFPVNPTAFAVALSEAEGAGELLLRINSPGGDVFAGVTMYNTLRQFKGYKTVQIDGLCASIAGVIAMGADEITMADTAMLMVHNPHVFVVGGDAPGLRATADLLDDVANATMLPAYARSGKSEAEIKAIMARTVYYSAAEAKQEGWIDTILQLPKPQRLAARVAFDLRAFENAPTGLAKAVDGCTCPCPSCIDGDCDDCEIEDCEYDGCTCDGSGVSASSRKKAAAAIASQLQTAEIAARVRDRSLRLADFD